MSDDPPILKTQALVVTAGEFEGRICLNDDDDLIFRDSADEEDIAWMEASGVVWRSIQFEAGEVGDEPEQAEVIDVEVVTFGYYLQSHGHYYIPRQFLRPATMHDLIERHQAISDVLSSAAFPSAKRKRPSMTRLYDLLSEQQVVADEIRARDLGLRKTGDGKKVFLCHASADKPYVRRVAADLTAAGYSIWFDEFEIQVGDSIIQKISAATESADAILIFVSKAALSSAWVEREWSSTLARSISGSEVKVIPILIEEVALPAIIADIRYADFRTSYYAGLRTLTEGLDRLRGGSAAD